MFESLEEVVEQWQLRYKALDMSFNLLPDIGYSEEDINRLENHLSISLHEIFKETLQRINLDTVSFKNLDFGGGVSYIDRLINNNWDTNYQDDSNTYIRIADAGTFILLLDNLTGNIFAVDHENRSDKRYVAYDFRELILVAASITVVKHPPFTNRNEAEQFFENLLDNKEIKGDRAFWIRLGRNAL